jgi:hypothetical protein
VKEFTTAVREVTEDSKDIPFTLDGKELIAHYPKDGQLAMLMVSIGRHRSQAEQIAGVIDFFVEVLDRESHEHIVNRLLDGDDPFGLEEITAIMEWMIEEWTGRPTQPLSVSTP